MEIDLTGTVLERRYFAPVHYGLFEQAATSGNEWISCKVERSRFTAAGGPLKLDEIINVFLRWAELDD